MCIPKAGWGLAAKVRSDIVNDVVEANLELTRFRGHLLSWREKGVYDGQTTCLPTGVS